MWWFRSEGQSGFSSSSTAEDVTDGIDGDGLTAIVTGASNGIGTETARVLALRGVHVIMAVRNMNAGSSVKERIIKEIPSAKIDAMELDLSSMSSVRKFVSDFDTLGHPLNVLINNAGIMGIAFTLSEDNIELQFATNHLGHFLLTHLLLDKMKETAHRSQIEGRIVNVASEFHKMSYRGGIRFDEINEQSGYRSYSAYGQSKLANILHANELSRQLKSSAVENITVNSLHPGVVATNILHDRGFLTGIAEKLAKYVIKSVHQGAATTCYLALHPQVKGVSGEYFKDCNLAKASSEAMNAEMGKRLWDLSMNLIR